jgi:mannose-6-phosphate isomerase-like protein (cupin superfamily)
MARERFPCVRAARNEVVAQVNFVQDLARAAWYNRAMSAEPIILAPGAGRTYDIGPMRGVFKADGDETGDRYCVSEWSVDPGQPGPGPHHHDSNEELFLVTAGTMSFLVTDQWIDAPAGTFIRIPAGVTHDFENRGNEAATAFNVFIPGGFEAPFREWWERSGASSRRKRPDHQA